MFWSLTNTGYQCFKGEKKKMISAMNVTNQPAAYCEDAASLLGIQHSMVLLCIAILCV